MLSKLQIRGTTRFPLIISFTKVFWTIAYTIFCRHNFTSVPTSLKDPRFFFFLVVLYVYHFHCFFWCIFFEPYRLFRTPWESLWLEYLFFWLRLFRDPRDWKDYWRSHFFPEKRQIWKLYSAMRFSHRANSQYTLFSRKSFKTLDDCCKSQTAYTVSSHRKFFRGRLLQLFLVQKCRVFVSLSIKTWLCIKCSDGSGYPVSASKQGPKTILEVSMETMNSISGSGNARIGRIARTAFKFAKELYAHLVHKDIEELTVSVCNAAATWSSPFKYFW